MSSDDELNGGNMSGKELEMNSDEELQEAFAAGLLKPGLNTMVEVKPKKPAINNVSGLKQKLEEITLKLPWIERLDMVNDPAKLAPELAYEEDRHSKERKKLLKKEDISQDTIHNDFKREMMFYRQAQAAVMEALPRLKSMGIKTKRPDDYFAQMAKSDEHMQKVREKLVSKQVTEERREKIRKLRDLKKFGKKVQVEVQQNRQKEKKSMLDQVKKFRKGQTDTLDFLDNDELKGNDMSNRKKQDILAKRKRKDKKFGFGGKKKGKKGNTLESLNNFDSNSSKKRPQSAHNLKAKRLGKNRRNQMKNRAKSRGGIK